MPNGVRWAVNVFLGDLLEASPPVQTALRRITINLTISLTLSTLVSARRNCSLVQNLKKHFWGVLTTWSVFLIHGHSRIKKIFPPFSLSSSASDFFPSIAISVNICLRKNAIPLNEATFLPLRKGKYFFPPFYQAWRSKPTTFHPYYSFHIHMDWIPSPTPT